MTSSQAMRAPQPLPWPLRHPFLVGSVLLHAALLYGLWSLGPASLAQAQARRDEALISASVAQAQRIQLQRRVRAIEQLQRELAGMPSAADAADLPTDAAALLQRAQRAAEALQQQAELQRAQTLAKLLGVPLPKALEQVRAQTPAPALAASAGSSAVEQLAQWERRAQQAAAEVARDAASAARGTAVTLDSVSSGQADGGQGGGAGAAVSGGEGRGHAGGLGGFRDERTYTPRAAAVAAARAAVRFATGRSLGPGGVLADRIYLNTWYIAGPFEGRGRQSLQTPYPPEWGVDLDAVYAGAGGSGVRWRYVEEPRYPFVPLPKRENAVYYAYTELRVDAAQDIWLDIGADDDTKLWLNDRLVWTSDDGDKPWYRQPFHNMRPEMARYGLVEGSRRVRLQAGRNTLMLKLYNGIDLMFFSVVLRP